MADKRTAMKLIRFTPAEIEAVAAHARACGQPVARYIRETALGAVPRIRRSQGNAELIRQLAGLGNNLNQLATVANATGYLPQETALRDAVHAILHAIRTVD
jgi:Bacterial mobilisation protein (MobC)